jgi:hypothetical protein
MSNWLNDLALAEPKRHVNASPPMRSTSTRPRSCTGHHRFRANAPDRALVNPARSASVRSSTAPTWDTTPVPSAVTRKSLDHAVDCTRRCLPRRDPCRCRNHKFPSQDRHFCLSTRRTTAHPGDHRESPRLEILGLMGAIGEQLGLAYAAEQDVQRLLVTRANGSRSTSASFRAPWPRRVRTLC